MATNETIEGIRTLIGDVIIAKDADGLLGNLTVEGNLICDSISQDGASNTYEATITGDGETTVFEFTHNLRSLSPSCTITDENGNVCLIDITFPSANTILITFPEAIAEGLVFNVSIRK